MVEHCWSLRPGGGGPPQQPAQPRYANYWAPLTHKRHPPQPSQPRHTHHWAPRTQKRHQQEHRAQRPTECSDRTQHAKGKTADCPGPRKETATRRNVTQGAACDLDRPQAHTTHTGGFPLRFSSRSLGQGEALILTWTGIGFVLCFPSLCTTLCIASFPEAAQSVAPLYMFSWTVCIRLVLGFGTAV